MVSELTQALKNRGLRLTAPRIMICRLLAESKHHPSAAQIYKELKPLFPSLSLATVYNTLNVLSEMGLISIIGHMGDGHIHFDTDAHPHANLSCTACHAINDYALDNWVEIEARLQRDSGYRIQAYSLVLYGLCPACQAKSQNVDDLPHVGSENQTNQLKKE